MGVVKCKVLLFSVGLSWWWVTLSRALLLLNWWLTWIDNDVVFRTVLTGFVFVHIAIFMLFLFKALRLCQFSSWHPICFLHIFIFTIFSFFLFFYKLLLKLFFWSFLWSIPWSIFWLFIIFNQIFCNYLPSLTQKFRQSVLPPFSLNKNNRS
jgi:hypothetical protein